jgi:hypothetical protein
MLQAIITLMPGCVIAPQVDAIGPATALVLCDEREDYRDATGGGCTGQVQRPYILSVGKKGEMRSAAKVRASQNSWSKTIAC